MNGNSIKTIGRSSSQRSIYDYPEHLNPFYEDENHKRLRFWKIGTSNSSRSNSFSVDGLKSFWTFKRFKLKKKSSTLGINKTSESPTMLLRHHNDGSLADAQLRHTINIGLESNFQRCAPKRSSLQNLSSNNQEENFFIRNNRYRSTVQASGSGLSNRYQSNPTIGPITPVFRSRYNQTPISRGSSQISVNSNPFDDEYETISEIGSPERTSLRHSARKKRRAPQPPVSPNKTPKAEIAAAKPQDSANITTLTAEIESFVRIADSDKEMLESTSNEQSIENKNYTIAEGESNKDSRQSIEHNECYTQDYHTIGEEITIEGIQSLGEMDENSNQRCKKSPVKILIRAPTEEEEIKISIELENNDDAKKETATVGLVQTSLERSEDMKENETEVKDQPNENRNKELKFQDQEKESDVNGELKFTIDNEYFDDAKNETITESSVQTSLKISEEMKVNETEDKDQPNESCNEELKIIDQIESISIGLPEEFITENKASKISSHSEVNELKIIESSDDLTQIGSNDESNKCVPLNERLDSTKYQNTFLTRVTESSIPLRVKEGTGFIKNDGKNKPPTPPQRRRSVKEIIESINKCQSLLKVNQDIKTKVNNTDVFQSPSSSSSKTFKSKSFFIDRNMNDTNEKEYQNKKLFTDMTEVNNNAKADEMCNIPLFVEKFNDFNRNNQNHDSNVLFELNEEKESNVECRWNPVPKPRRHRN